MATLKELRGERLRKLEELKKLGVNPYPADSHRTHKVKEVIEAFDTLENQKVTIAGRIMTTRKFGKIAFFVLKDATGQVQLFLKHDILTEAELINSELSFEHINLLDPGDFIEATGKLIKTQTGEISVEVYKLRLLTKSLRSLPTEQEGFTDKEQRLRRRYVDTNVNKDVYERFVRRSKFWQATRDFLNKEDFIEINTPVLEHTTGGADANPFVTHMDALDEDFYLRISHELPLKRLIGGGYEKVYDIGPRFRNENYSDEHLPEHVAMEWYWAYADWEDGMKLTQNLVRYVADKTWETKKFELANGQTVDLGSDEADFPRISFVKVMKDRYGLDVLEASLEDVVAKLKEAGGEVEKIDNKARVIDKLWKKIRVELPGPAFLVDVPDFLQPLAKRQAKDERLTEQFNLILGGTEVCKAYTELNNPLDQLGRFLEQQKMRDEGDNEAQMLDIDFVEMLEYGMPPTCGYGHAERLFWVLDGVSAREGVVFPPMRQEINEVTKSIYPQLYQGGNATTRNRRPHTISIQNEKASETNRLGYQLAVILNKTVETGRAINAAAHVVSGFVGTLSKPDQLNYLEYRDKTGELDAIISHHPTIILEASDSKELLKAYRKAQTDHIPANTFIETMTIGSSQEEIELLKTKTINELNFWGVVLFGKTEDVQKITKAFQLWK